MKRLLIVLCCLWVASPAFAQLGVQKSDYAAAAGVQVNQFGKMYFVDGTNGSDNNGGLTPASAFATLAAARSASAAGDTVIVAPGTYTVDVGTASLAPKANQTWMAGMPALGGAPTVIIIADADDNANAPVAVDVDGVVFRDLEFRLVAGGTTALYCMDAGQTSAVRGLTFDGCWFNMNSVDGAGVIAARFNDGTNAITGLLMRNCHFIGGDATTNQSVYIDVGVGGLPDGLITGNSFALESADGDALAIRFLDPGAAAKSYAVRIIDNLFIGASDGGDDAIPIEFAGAMTEDEIVGVIADNTFAHCGPEPITLAKMDGGIVNNWDQKTVHNVVRAAAVLPQTTAHALFTITGGNVEILGVAGEVTIVIGAVANATKLTYNPTAAGASTDLCTANNIISDAVGTMYSMTGDTTQQLRDGIFLVQELAQPLIMGPGTIDLDCGGSTTGEVQWHIVYRKLEPAASLIAS